MDICLTAFACSSSAPCSQWAKDYFAEPPAVVWVPGNNSTQFEQVGQQAAMDVVAWSAFHARCKPEEVGRIAVVTFSAGWGFVYRLLKSAAARSKIDAVILLDGMHTRDLDGPKAFAASAARGGPLLLMAHTQIVPPYVSTTVTNTEIMGAAYTTGRQGCAVAPEYVSAAVLDAPVTLGNQYGHRTFDHDTLERQDNVGSAWCLEYEGASAADHIYCCLRVQPRLWRWLGERWADTTVGVQANPAP